MNIFDGLTTTPSKSRTPLSQSNDTLPPSVIAVNPYKGMSSQSEFGSMIVRFDWTLLAQTVAPSYHIRTIPFSQVKEELRTVKVTDMSEYNSIINELGFYFETNNIFIPDAETIDENLNREVNKSLLSVTTSTQTAIASGTASIELENVDYQWIFQMGANRDGGVFSDLTGKSLFLEGLYVTIDAKGRFDNTKFYRIFSGSVKHINISDDPLNRKISLQCRDLSKFLTNVRYNIHPAFFETDPAAIQQNATILTSNLANKDNVSIAKAIIPTIDKANFNNPVDKYSFAAFKEMWNNPDISVYTQQTQLGETEVVTDNYRYTYSESKATFDVPEVKAGLSETYALVWGDEQVDNANGTFISGSKNPVYQQMFGVSQLFLSEFKYRSDILNETAALTHFSTYVDSNGNIHFHPPRYDYLEQDKHADGYPILPLTYLDGSEEDPHAFILDPGESISESYSSDEDSFVTALQIYGESDFGINTQIRNIDPNYNRPYVIWIDGMKRFGFKVGQVSTAAIQDPTALKTFALACFLRRYLERENMTCTIPMRPELDIDRPFYSSQYQKIFHITGLTHNYTAGGDKSPGVYTTAVNCNAGRPLSQATLITTNIFRTISYDQLVSRLQENGLNIQVTISGG